MVSSFKAIASAATEKANANLEPTMEADVVSMVVLLTFVW